MNYNVRNSVNRLLNFDTQAESNALKNKIDNLYGRDTTSSQTVNKFNPFVNQKAGKLINPYADYQPILDSNKTNNEVKNWISEATGLAPTTVNTTSENTDTVSSYDDVNFDANIDSSTLGGLDVATELPKLSSAQIAKVIKTHFNNSPVISENDAQGIYNAQKTTGMSALAILGIGALESGWGTSNIAKKTNNIWGYGATNVNPEGNAHRYSQMSEGATQFASEFMKTYYNGYGAKSINMAGTGNNPKGMGYAYTDGGAIDSSWATKVNSIMGKLYNTAKSVLSSSNTSQANSIVNAAKNYIGTPYVWGGESMSEGGMDCSGFVYNALKDAGYNVDRTTAQGYRSYGTKVNKADMKPGDLLFFGKGDASHIGIYIGSGKMIHSSGGSSNTASNPGKGVSITNVDYRSDFIEARRY